MKRSILLSMVTLFALALTAPAFAQYPPDFDQFLSHHPNDARMLSANPSLLYNPNWRAQHPQLQQYFEGHPGVWKQLKFGDYDEGRTWHDAYWWHDHHPSWFWEHHPEWAEVHPQWRGEDGDFDDHHVWHYGRWWYENHPEWVEHHHPDWLQHREKWEMKAEKHEEKREMKAEKHEEKREHKHGQD